MNTLRVYRNGVNDRLINDLFSMFNYNDTQWNGNHCGCVPANVIEEDKTFRVELYVPGFTRDEISISVDNRVMTVSSSRKEVQDDDTRYVKKEFGIRNFERKFILDRHVDSENITAEYHDGILRIVVPKKQEFIEKTRKEISIQ